MKDGIPNGQGTSTFRDGGKYIGEYREGLLNGQGTFTWSNGNKYVGEFKDGLLNGQGISTLFAFFKKNMITCLFETINYKH